MATPATPQPYADVDDLAAGWRPLSDDEQTRAAALIARASRMIRVEYPETDNRIASGSLPADVVSDIVLQMVQTAMLSPLIPVDQETYTAGPFSNARHYTNPTGDLFLTKAMRNILTPKFRRAYMGWVK